MDNPLALLQKERRKDSNAASASVVFFTVLTPQGKSIKRWEAGWHPSFPIKRGLSQKYPAKYLKTWKVNMPLECKINHTLKTEFGYCFKSMLNGQQVSANCCVCTHTRVSTKKAFLSSLGKDGHQDQLANTLGMLSCELYSTESWSSGLHIQNSCTNSKTGLYKQERAHSLPEQQHKPLTNFLKVWVVSSISYLERSTVSLMGKSPGAYDWPVCSAEWTLGWHLFWGYQYLLHMVISGPSSCCTNNEEHSPQKCESKWTCTVYKPVVKSLGSSFHTFHRVTGLEGNSAWKRLTEVSNLLLKEGSALRTDMVIQGSFQSGLEALHGQRLHSLFWVSYFTTWLPSELKFSHISSPNPSFQLISAALSHHHFMC